jgi:hypothetical protein
MRALKTARLARPLIEGGEVGVFNAENGLTIPPELLLKMIGKSTEARTEYSEAGDRKRFYRLNYCRLAHQIFRNHVLSYAQRHIIENEVGAHFVESTTEHPLLFLDGYELYAGLWVSQKDWPTYSWPIEEDGLYLNDHSIKGVGNFAYHLERRALEEQPYLMDFIYGAAGELFLNRLNQRDKNDFAVFERKRIIAAGVGLASLHLELFLGECADEAALYAQESVGA